MLRSRAGTHWPKSMSLTWADDVSRMLLPLTSRCMTRWAWRWLSAWHNISSSSQLMSHSIQTYRPIHVDRSTLDANSHHGRKTDGVGRRQLMRTLVKTLSIGCPWFMCDSESEIVLHTSSSRFFTIGNTGEICMNLQHYSRHLFSRNLFTLRNSRSREPNGPRFSRIKRCDLLPANPLLAVGTNDSSKSPPYWVRSVVDPHKSHSQRGLSS